MAYIAPNSTIEFFADFGLDSNYENTMYFATTATKDTYFNGILKEATVTAQSYTRAGRGVIKVQLPMSTMYKCGYMRFKNTSFENKWFYAFITGVDYINNITTEVRFEIDGAFTLEECFVERQHTLGDNIGDNIADEGIPCGDYKYEFVTSSGYIGSNGFWYCFASTFNPADMSDATGAEYGGIYSGVMYSYTNDPTVLNTWITRATTAGKSDGIVGIAIVPYSFITDVSTPVVEKGQTFNKPYTSIDGYVPKNNKMFIYPYKSIQVTNLEGNFAEFRYEFFSGTAAQFEFIGITGLNTEIVCSPVNYKGQQANISEKISMSDFPMCTYNIDAYKAYIAQNKSSIAASAVSAGLQMVGAIAGAGGMAVSDIPNSIPTSPIQLLGKLKDYDRKPPQAGGSQGNSALFGRPTGHQKKDFWFLGKTITANYARMIDDYFTMYGYAINQVQTPNMNARPYYTYVKTLGCIVKGEMPADDSKAIENIFDSGVRFWKNHNNIGHYQTLNNSPT